LKKRTSINSHLTIYKEKEMAEFRKIFYALAMVTLLAALSAPAFAAGTLSCRGSGPTPPFIRTEGHTELVGEVQINCTGGTSTLPGVAVPKVTIRIRLTTNITSKLLTGAANVCNNATPPVCVINPTDNALANNEALLIIDEPNSGRYQPNIMAATSTGERPLLACGAAGAPDTSASGRNVCDIIAPNSPTRTYDGVANGWAGITDTGAVVTCDGVAGRPAAGTFGCGRPNVFQGHYVSGFSNMVEFSGVPFDPPGNAEFNDGLAPPNSNRTPWVRTLRFANLRTDANAFFVAGNNSSIPILADIEFNGNTGASIDASAGLIVAYATSGLNTPTVSGTFTFVQCINSVLPSLNGIENHARDLLTVTPTVLPMFIRFTEGFNHSWKTKGWEQMQANSTVDGVGNRAYTPLSFATPTTVVRQNVPGAAYNTESGFSAPTNGVDPIGLNPPSGVGTQQTIFANQSITNSTGISDAGIATNGTRLQILFGAVPAGVTIFTPDVVFLTRIGTNVVTGVAIRNLATDPNRGALSPPGAPSQTHWTAVTANNLAVYEVIYNDKDTQEDMTVPIGVTTTNALPQTIDVSTTVKGGFAPSNTSGDGIPLLTSAAAGQLPRFFENLTGGGTLFSIVKCNCNLLFPYVSNAAGFDTGIAIANTSLSPTDPTFTQTLAQSGPVQFWYFAGGALAKTECTNVANKGVCPGTTFVPSGGVMTFTVAGGSNVWGLNGGPAGFTGYVIAKTGFQYCHGFAYFSDLNRAVIPGIYGTSVGYLGLVMDTEGGRLTRTTNTAFDSLNQ